MTDADRRDAVAPALDADNPWPGLASYDEAAREYFSGRAAETAELARRIADDPVTVLYGKSGLGKSSLLGAGVAPLLRERGQLPVFVRLRHDADAPPLIEQLAAALFDAFAAGPVKHPPRRDGEPLWDYLHRDGLAFWAPKIQPVRPVFVLDQFEEVFTLGAAGRPGVEAFREQLADLAENRIPAALARRIESGDAARAGLDLHAQPYRLVLSLREDFLPELEGWQAAMPSLRRNRMRLLPMRTAQALTAVCNDRTRHLVDEALARRIVGYLAGGAVVGGATGGVAEAADDEPDRDACVEPALLSLVCRGINDARRRAGKPRFDDALFDAGKGTIVADFCAQSLADQPARVRRFIEDELVTDQGFRNSFAVAAAIGQGSVTRDEIRVLVGRRLLRLEHHLGAERVELTHDLLTRAVLASRGLRLAAERSAALRKRVLKYGGIAALVLVGVVGLGWQQYTGLVKGARKDQELARVRLKSAEEAEASRAALQTFYNQLALSKVAADKATVAAEAATERAKLERDSAVKAGRIAHSGELTAQAVGIMSDDRQAAARLALEAMRVAETPDAHAALVEAVRTLWPTARLSADQLGGQPRHVAIDAKGSRLAVVAGDGQVSLWDVHSRQPRQVWRLSLPDQGVTVTEFEPGGKRLLVARRGQIDVLDLASGAVDPRAAVPMPPQAAESDLRQLALSGDDGRWLAIGNTADAIYFRDRRDATATWSEVQGQSAIEFSLSPDGQRIAWVARGTLGAAVAERGVDGVWTQRPLTVGQCSKLQSVATASGYVVATWLAQSCAQSVEPGSAPSPPNTDDAMLVMRDNVASADGKAFVSILRNFDLRVGRGDPANAQGVSLISSTEDYSDTNMKGTLAVDGGATRLAMIRGVTNEQGRPGGAAVDVVSVGAHKLLLAELPRDEFRLLDDGRRIVRTVQTPGGAELQVTAIDQVLSGRELPQGELRCALTGVPERLLFGSRRVAVTTAGPPDGATRTTVVALAPGCRSAGPFAGEVSLLGRDDELLLIRTTTEAGAQASTVIVQRAADGQRVAQWDLRGGRGAGWELDTSARRTALFVSRPGGPGQSTRVVDAFAVRGDRLVPAGRVVDLPASTNVLSLTISDDARTLGETRALASAATAAGAAKRVDHDLQWPLDPARETRADDAAAARQVAAAALPAGAGVEVARSRRGRFTVVRRTAPAGSTGSASFSVVGGDRGTVGHVLPAGSPKGFRFSDDERWLSYIDGGYPRVLDLETLKPLLPWPGFKGSVDVVDGGKLMKIWPDETREPMLVPLDAASLQRFATWLLPDKPPLQTGAPDAVAASARRSGRPAR